jgi:diketogulonate reductase-like aldo/keto reductase
MEGGLKMSTEKKVNPLASGIDMDDLQKLLSSVTPENMSQILEMLKVSLTPEQLKTIESLMANLLANMKKK